MTERSRPPYRPVILHADMDAFYASVEQRDHPELRGRPVMVGGTSVRGVVMAASYEARSFGVRSAMPTVQARKLCPDGVFLRGDMRKYRRVSAEIRDVFASVSPAVEPISLDEAFIDITGSIGLLGAPRSIGRQLKERVRAATDLTVSVGIGPGKMVAKIASDVSKPDGLLEVAPAQVARFLRPLPVSRLWGVGPVTEAALARAGITTVGDLSACPRTVLDAHLGAAADHLALLARGLDPRVVVPDRAAKSYGEEGTFETDTADDRVVRPAIVMHAEAVARRLRADRVRARVVVLKMKLARGLGHGRFRLLTRRATLVTATDDGHVLSEAALQLWDRRRPHSRLMVRLIGVAVTGIAAADQPQLPLFPDRRARKHAAINRALDEVVARFGPTSIARGGVRRDAPLTTRIKQGE